jgi:CheY-like chemotaxis protein
MSYKVLVVDDSKLARMAFAKALATLRPGWARIEAANADEAVAALSEHKPDFAVVDFNMPGRDGLDLAAQFRDLNPAMPVAVISANHQQEIIDRAHAADAMFLSKPLTEPALEEFLTVATRRLKALGA